jgi:predicted transcriptional regulator of viral defense system
VGSPETGLKKLKVKKVMRASELAPYISTRTQLRRMVEAGELIAIGSGLYAHPSIDPFTASLIATARYYPNAIISNITALVVHDLSDERVDRIDVDIPRNSSIRNKLIRTHRVAAQNITGAIRLNYQGHKLRIYCKERVLCDAYRIDPDGPLFLKAMKRYVKEGEVDADSIAKYDKALSTNVLRSLRQELADE